MSRRRMRQSRPSSETGALPSGASSEGGFQEGAEPPFTHFLSPFSRDRISPYENMPEEIVSVPDLVDRIPDASTHSALGPLADRKDVFCAMSSSTNNATTSKTSSSTEDALHTLNTLASVAASSGLSHYSREAADLPRIGDFESGHDIKTEPICHVTTETPDDDSTHNNQNDSDAPIPPRSNQQSGMQGPYLLKKETHCTTILDQLLKDDTFTDVTLTSEGQSIKAHKMVLCLASNYFKQVLSKESNVQSVIVFRDVKYNELKNIINFIYTGEATVDASELESFMSTAQMLEIQSLCEGQNQTLAQSLVTPNKRRRQDDESSTRTKKSKAAPNRSKATAIPAAFREEYIPLLLSTSMQEGSEQLETGGQDSVNRHEEAQFDDRMEKDVAMSSLVVSSPVSLVKTEEYVEDGLDYHDPDPVPGRCPHCPTSCHLTNSNDMFQHLLAYHSGMPSYPCQICLRIFTDNSKLQSHIPHCLPSSEG